MYKIDRSGGGSKKSTVYNYFACLSFCLHVKTAEPIGPTFCVGPHMIPSKDYGPSKLEKLKFYV